MPEPNSPLSAAEKTAIMRFIQNGGGFFLIVDHTGSDRNNDGWDSVRDRQRSVHQQRRGQHRSVRLQRWTRSTSPTRTRWRYTTRRNPVLSGGSGTVTGSIIRDGSTQTLHPSDNPNVRGLVWRPSANQSGTTGAFFSTSTFGSGRVAIWGDSSPIDDGTGQSGNTLYDGWDDPAGTDAALALNATAWLAGSGTTGGGGGGGGGGTGCTAAQLLGNPGFETGAASPWTTGSAVLNNSSSEPAHGGSWDAWLDGYGATHTDTLSAVGDDPGLLRRRTLTFWLHVDTAETTPTTRYDTLTVAVGGSTVASYSNLDAAHRLRPAHR